MKEDPKMCEAVNELFADQIKEKAAIISNLQNEIDTLKAEHDEEKKNLLATIADLQAKLAQKSSDWPYLDQLKMCQKEPSLWHIWQLSFI